MDTVAIIGSAGQLGTDLVAACDQARYRVVPLSHQQIEVTDPASVRAALAPHRPQAVINCAAYVQVDEAEDHPDLAFQVNAIGAFHVARISAELGARCVSVSTNYVFDGTQARPYREDDVPVPLNVYGASKLAGEHLVREASPEALIVRVGGLFGRVGIGGRGGNFIETILAQARKGASLHVVQGAVLSLSYTPDIARAIISLIERKAAGLLHVANSGSCPRLDLTRRLLSLCQLSTEVKVIPAAAFTSRAKRPLKAVLDTSTFETLVGSPLPPWEDALARYLEEKSARA